MTKKFSCGHKLVSRIMSEQNIAVKESVALEKRLGPQSTAPISFVSSHDTSITVVSMQQEMYKDAIYFFQQAKTNKTNGGEPFITWRDLRAAILFSFAALESCINQFIDDHLENDKSNMSQSDIDYWTDKLPDRHPSIAKKLNDGVELFGGKGKRLEADIPLWKDFGDLRQLRNDLVHFKVSNRILYNTEALFVKVEQGIRTAGSVIKRIYLAHPQNHSYPSIFDTVP